MNVKLLSTCLCGTLILLFTSGWEESPEQVCHQDELIGRTQNIVLATVISAVSLPENGEVLYQFKTEEVIKGNAYCAFPQS
ncbi:hypothetical protein [Pontiella desulfatans]|uniref:hypothetical protein n=1 Tax=Pontiella desulfatans TaxID=2750659 RepID=UPI00109D65EB|nr:hypothetical protein [Pontiella desulfatans]